ncbi:cohesin domain-containing protein, partial [Paenibacillus sepulcri]|nr:cohesin domain-containing protein [Paenibacillus sepulcri]
MLRRKFTALGLCLLLGLSLFPYAAMGADTPHFSLSANNEAPAVGQDIRVTVQGEQLTDLYGYELRMSYDAEHLRFKSASSHWTGLTVPAMDKDGEIVFAHTKLGKTAGENGKAAIATLSFESIAAGETAVVLTRVKLVDSQVEAVTLTPDVELKLDIASAENAVT